MSRTAGSLLVIVAFLMVGWTGCNQSSSPEVNEDEPAQDNQQPDCSVDADCESYYRCLQGECGEPPAMTGQRDQNTPVAEIVDGDETVAQFYLELAVTEDEQATGLMYREEMLPDWGMLFIYEEEQELSFWMKNTFIELDMIFIDAAGEVVGVIDRAEPLSTQPRSVNRPARYVLEVLGGLAEEQGIEPGTRMRLQNVEDAYQPDQ